MYSIDMNVSLLFRIERRIRTGGNQSKLVWAWVKQATKSLLYK